MTINTQFGKGDKIYFVEGQIIRRGTVSGLKIYLYPDANTPSINYTIKNDSLTTINENSAFATLKEAEQELIKRATKHFQEAS